MRHCPNCGSALPPDVSNCPYCGAPCACHAAPPSPAGAQENASAAPETNTRTYTPHYARERSVCPDGGLTTAQYFWSLILFAVPIIGWFFLFYWAFGSHVETPRQRLARAVLIKTCVWLVVGAVALVALVVGFFSFLDDITDAWYGYGGPHSGPFSEYYDDPFGMPYYDPDDNYFYEDPNFNPEMPSHHHHAAMQPSCRGFCDNQAPTFRAGRCHQ